MNREMVLEGEENDKGRGLGKPESPGAWEDVRVKLVVGVEEKFGCRVLEVRR